MKLSFEPALDMVVVADTSPVNYFVLIEQIELLTRLYTRILIPPARSGRAEASARIETGSRWACDTPKWLEVLSPMPKYCSWTRRPDGRNQFEE